MHRLLALSLILLLATRASAQTGPPARTATTDVELQAQATFQTSYLLALYMTQLANAGTPVTPSDLDEAARQYFTNGAAATGVPTSGARADYFRNGAAVTGVPSSGPGSAYFRDGARVTAYDPARGSSPSPAATGEREAPPAEVVRSTPTPEDASAPRPDAGPDESAPSTPAVAESGSVQASGSPGPSGAACATLDEMEAALAIASHAGVTAPPPTCEACPPTPIASVTPACAETVARSTTPLPCPPGPSILSRILPVMGGVLFGGLAVFLWTHPRTRAGRMRLAPRRS